MDIERIKESNTIGFNKGDHIIIQEKIDGANAAIRYDSVTDTIIAQSRKQILNINNNLRGFYEWSQTLDKKLVKSILGNNLILFGEWLCSHTVKYPDDKYNNLYSYDVYDSLVFKQSLGELYIHHIYKQYIVNCIVRIINGDSHLFDF